MNRLVFPPLRKRGFMEWSGSCAILEGDVRETLQRLPDKSVHCVITSPPYFKLRDYETGTWEGGDPSCDHVISKRMQIGVPPLVATTAPHIANEHIYKIKAVGVCPRCGATCDDRQIGAENTVDTYVKVMVGVMREVRRVLRDDGTLWLNIGDSFATSTSAKPKRRVLENHEKPSFVFKPKDKHLVPFRLAIALQEDGWWVRQDNIWAKPRPAPDSVTDRTTCAHEYVFHLTKSQIYYYDQESIRDEVKPGWYTGKVTVPSDFTKGPLAGKRGQSMRRYEELKGANRRDVWEIPLEPYLGDHQAVFPQALPTLCLLAGTSERGCCAQCGDPWIRVIERSSPAIKNDRRKGPQTGWAPSCKCNAGDPVPCIVLDPFGGHGTTALAAGLRARNSIMCELNATYAKSIKNRLTQHEVQVTELIIKKQPRKTV